MNLVNKYKASFLYSIYLSFIVIVLNGGILYNYVGLTLLSVYLILSTIFINIFIIKITKSKVQEYLAVSFVVTSFIDFLIFWSLFIKDWDGFLLLLGLFVVPSLLPASYVLLKSLFKSNETSEKTAIKHEKTKPDIIFENASINLSQEIEDKKFILENENGKVLIELSLSQIICFEASDNYAVTYYLNQNNEVKKSMERVSLKKIEEILSDLNSLDFERVHKSYIVNKNFIEELKGKAQAYKLKMNNLQIQVPVSRSYDINIIKKLID